MSNITVVLAEIYGDVSYGVDYNQFIIGAYLSQEEAEQKILALQDSMDIFVTDDNNMLFADTCGALSLMTEEEFLKDRIDEVEYIDDESERAKYLNPHMNAKKYKDFNYCMVTVDNSKPVFSAGAMYIE